jgi:uncharacterized Zn-finger protein
MNQKHEITELALKVAECAGDDDLPHRRVEIILFPDKVVSCPICGHRFRRADPSGKIDPAVWPKGD